MSDETPVIFSEGKSYWGTFRPIVNEFIRQKINFRYISLDLHDPALTIESEYMHSILFPKGLTAFRKIEKVQSPVMLSTTPNIGTEGYPLGRPVKVKTLVHVFHAMSCTANYRLGSLDEYDSVIMIGEHEEKPIREIEKQRNLGAKELIACGLPYLDDLYHNIPKDLQSDKEKKTVLVAPSWGKKGCFSEYGIQFVKDLASHGYEVIIRLHPQSYVTEPELVEEWVKETESFDNIEWDTEMLGSQAMHQSDILISDTSSIRFDYAFLYSKPVVTLEIPQSSREEFESKYLNKIWSDDASPKLGAVLNKASIKDLPSFVEKILGDHSSGDIRSFRDKSISNFGNSAPFIVSYLVDKISSSKVF